MYDSLVAILMDAEFPALVRLVCPSQYIFL